jgi:hypothetical protein
MGERYTLSLSGGVRGIEGAAERVNSMLDSARERAKRQLGPISPAEKIAREGLAEDVLQRLALLRPPVDQGAAELRWGKPARFQLTEPAAVTDITYTTIVNSGTGGDEEPPAGAKLIEYDEYQRSEEEIRVENPDDPEQYVMVRRCIWIAFQRRDDGVFIRLNFRNPDAA